MFCVITGKTSQKHNPLKLKVKNKTFIPSSMLLRNLGGTFPVVGSSSMEHMKVNNLLVSVFIIYIYVFQ